MNHPASGPLSGVRVIDMTTSYAGPTAAMYLADLGAEVIKVERPGAGDDTRSWGPPFVDGQSAWFASANRNKSSIVINLRDVDGMDLLETLVSSADVFLHNVNPAKVERLGIDEASVTNWNPGIVYCGMSGFGSTGPDHALPGYDLIAQARSGLMSVTGPKGGGPERVSTALSDVVTAMSAAIAICAALYRRRETSVGETIDVSLLDSDLALMAPRIAAYCAGETEPLPSGGTDSVLAVYQPFETKDRTIVVAIGNDAMWKRFCEVVGLQELLTDGSLVDNAGRRARRPEITATISERLRTRRADEWLKLLADADVPAAPVKSLAAVVADPQVVERGSIMPVPDGDAALVSVRAPFRLKSQPRPRNERFPTLGADTRRILSEHGYDAERIDSLIAAGTVEAVDDVAVHAGEDD